MLLLLLVDAFSVLSKAKGTVDGVEKNVQVHALCCEDDGSYVFGQLKHHSFHLFCHFKFKSVD